ncbi:MAG TPA: hypothetical protein VGL53_09070 [Bryobacteraceae bacterium]|jgi:hypothetical protein
MNLRFILMTALLLVPCYARAPEILTACSTLSDAEAVKLLGGPLGEVSKDETTPSDENGNDHQTACGHFPKGYSLEHAAGPPERGILITLHTMPNKDAAKRYYDGVYQMLKGMPAANGGGSNITSVSGIGESAYLKRITLPKSTSKIVALTFLKRSVMVDIQIWKSSGSVDEIARQAARQVLAKLP